MVPVNLEIYLLTVSQFLAFILHPTLSLEFEGECKKRCEERRPFGVTGPFKFDCNSAYSSPSDQARCREVCESCPAEVCDETISDHSANNWHCPSAEALSKKCIGHCNEYRVAGQRGEHALDCDKRSKYNDRQICRNKCGDCPSFICEDGHIFHCPHDNFNEKCRIQCDKARGSPQSGDFTFKCGDKYSEDTERHECQKVCNEDCPFYVCNDNNKYHCPDILLDGECKKLCDNNRPYNSDGSYTLDCDTDLYSSSTDCSTECGNCGSHVCVSPGNVFHCPKKEPKIMEEPLAKVTYKGPCKDKCNRNRGGGGNKYTLDCDLRYDTSKEKADCRTDCSKCPDDVCSSSKENVFECKADAKSRRDPEEDLQRQINEEKKKRDEFLESIDKDIERTNSEQSVILGVGIPIFLIILGISIGCLYFIKKRNSVPPTTTVQYATYGGVQQQVSSYSTLGEQQQQLSQTAVGNGMQQQPPLTSNQAQQPLSQ